MWALSPPTLPLPSRSRRVRRGKARPPSRRLGNHGTHTRRGSPRSLAPLPPATATRTTTAAAATAAATAAAAAGTATTTAAPTTRPASRRAPSA